MKLSLRPENANLLDTGHAHRMAGQYTEALRIATALLEVAPENIGAALLASATLIANDELFVAGEAAERLVDAFVRRGDLPHALVAAKLVAAANMDIKPLYEQIAKAFAKESSRLADVAPMPPALPATALDTSDIDALDGGALNARAEKALQAFLSHKDSVAENSKLPRLPLFSSLSAKEMVAFFEGLGIIDVGDGDVVCEQGADGREAYMVARGLLQALRTDENGQETSLAGLGAGALFGEMALVSDAPRAASIVAREPSILLVISREALERAASREPAISRELAEFCRVRMVSNLIRYSETLNAVSADKREALIARFQTRAFAAGETLVKKDSESEGLFLIASGRVQVVGTDQDGDKITITTLGPGDVVGEISLVLRKPATADVVAMHPTFALELTRAKFHDAIKEHPTLLNELYELATAREEETRNVTTIPPMAADEFVLV